MVVFTLIGPPGVGKGTLAGRTGTALNLLHVSTGQLIREQVALGTALGRRVQSAVAAGAFVDDATVTELVREELDALGSSYRGIVLDGYPRTLRQAELLDALLAQTAIPLARAISLEAPTDTLEARLTGRRVCPDCGRTYHMLFAPPQQDERCDDCDRPLERRADDAPDTVRERLRIYHLRSAPILDYYQTRDVLSRLDATGTPDACATALDDLLRRFL